VSGLRRIRGAPAQIAAGLRQAVRERVGLPITVGVARTKFLAKVASRVAKPDGLLVVPVDGELAFLHPLPVRQLWGVGPATAGKLLACGIRTVGDVARIDEPTLVSILGQAAGRHLHALAHNQDPRPVQVGRRRKSIGSQQALGRGRRSVSEVDAVLVGLVDRVTRRMRAAGRVGRTVTLRLRFDDFSRATRSSTLRWGSDQTQTILAAARALLTSSVPLIHSQGLTLIGVAVANFAGDGALQLELPFDHHDESGPPAGGGQLVGGRLDAALDAVRERFGTAAVTRAILLGRDPGISVPLLPD
jgi:DNA polymerase-4